MCNNTQILQNIDKIYICMYYTIVATLLTTKKGEVW